MISLKRYMKIAIVSNDTYGEGLDQLHGANYISQQLYEYFKNITLNPDEDIILLKDTDHTKTVDNLFKFIKNTSQDNCVFLFYFCGHGKISSNNFSDLIMALHDTSLSNFNSVGLKFSDLIFELKNSKFKKIICIVDSCCSGVINSTMGEDESIFKEDICDEGTVYISSGKGSLPAYEVLIEGKAIPCFSYCFWKVLTERKNDKCIYSIEEIFRKTKALVKDLDSRMNPQITKKNYLHTEKLFPNINYYENLDTILDVIDWRITSKCDNKCDVCYACNDTDEIKDLSEDKIDVILEKLSHINCKSICISGGEPTLSKYFQKIIKDLYQHGFSIFLSTNGYKYMAYRDEIEQYIEKLSLPLDGFDESSNRCNGRNENSFAKVKEILEFYNNNGHNFQIKISTVLTSHNHDVDYLSKILNLIKKYDISIWKIYEFIPENRGAVYKTHYTTTAYRSKKIIRWINGIKNDYNFKIEYVSREKRNAAYFIIQSNGEVIIPMEDDNNIVIEQKVGNITSDNFIDIVNRWRNYVNEDNYISNVELRHIRQLFILRPYDKKILHTIISRESIPSLNYLSEFLNDNPKHIESKINKLYENRIIKNITPIINLKMFGISTYLVNINFSKYLNCPEGYLEDYLCYNAQIGWVTKCTNNTYRIALFAKDQMDVIKILDEIKRNLDHSVQYDIHDLRCAYAIGEEKIFLNLITEHSSATDSTRYNSSTQKEFSNVRLSYEEFYTLRELENLRKPLKENVDHKIFLKSDINFNKNIISLQDKGVIEKILVNVDTRVLGYSWYVIFVTIENDKIDDLIYFLRTKFKSITHINSLVPKSSQWNLDFEIHTTSFAEVNEVIELIEKQFNTIITDTPLKIIKECKFSFLTHYVSDIILKSFVLDDKDREGETDD